MIMSSQRIFHRMNPVLNPFLVTSNFLGGPTSKAMLPVVSGTPVHPVFPTTAQQPSTGLTGCDHWKLERVVAVAMLAIIPGSFVFDSVFMNYLLAASIAIHAHWGMDAVLLDYCPRKALRLANVIRYVLTIVAFFGLCYFNHNAMGITKALKAIWSMY